MEYFSNYHLKTKLPFSAPLRWQEINYFISGSVGKSKCVDCSIRALCAGLCYNTYSCRGEQFGGCCVRLCVVGQRSNAGLRQTAS